MQACTRAFTVIKPSELLEITDGEDMSVWLKLKGLVDPPCRAEPRRAAGAAEVAHCPPVELEGAKSIGLHVPIY